MHCNQRSVVSAIIYLAHFVILERSRFAPHYLFGDTTMFQPVPDWYRETIDPYRDCPDDRSVWACADYMVGAVSIGSFELNASVCGGRGESYGIWIGPSWSHIGVEATNQDEESHMVVFGSLSGLLTCGRKGRICGARSPREHTRARRAGTHLQQALIETGCAIGISGGVNSAPLGIRHCQA